MSKKFLVCLALVGLVGSACGADSTGVAADAEPGARAAAVVDAATAAGGDGSGAGEQRALGATADDVAAEAVVYEEGTLGALLQADTVPATSGRFEGSVEVNGPVGSEAGHLSLAVSGSFDETDRAVDLTIDLSGLAGAGGDLAGLPPHHAAALEEPARVRVVGDMAYVNWGLLALVTGVDGAWLAVPVEELAAAGSSYGMATTPTNPADLLAAYHRAFATSLEDLGTETIRGTETRHWRAVLDLAALAELADPAEGAALRAELAAAGITEVPVDVWLGVDDGQIRRFETALTVSDDAGTGTVAVAFELYDLGAEIDIAPPPPAEVVEAPALGSF